MILVVGGAFQGKKEYAMQQFGVREDEAVDGCSCEIEELFRAKAILHFQEYIRRCLEQGREIRDLAKALAQKNPGIVIVANELGCGVVPADAFDRRYRETVGRVCCELAKEADEVHRVVCGIGTVIKHG